MLNMLTKKRNEQKKKKGFTLIELIIVIAIIAILVALAVPKFMNVTESAKINADIANARTIESAITTARATDKLTFKGATTQVDLEKMLQSVPKGKYTDGVFAATYDIATDDIVVTIVDSKGATLATVLGKGQDSKYANAK